MRPEAPDDAALDLDPLLWIHRDPRGYIGFARKPDPDGARRLDKEGNPYAYEHLAMIRVADLRQMFPSLVQFLLRDSYFTVHSFFQAAKWSNPITGFSDVWRRETNALFLTACYADIDCGRPESADANERMDWLQAMMRAESAMDRGIIPQASIAARSGRGIYLFWLLRDEQDPQRLPKAWPEVIENFKTINRALQQKLASVDLPVDLKAFDVARVLRQPGTVHSKTGRRASYWLRGDASGGYVYTLRELAQFVDVSPVSASLPQQTRLIAAPLQYRKTRNKGSAPARSAGSRKLGAMRAQDLLTINQARGGFAKRAEKHPDATISPGRRFVLTLYANFLNTAKEVESKALEAMRTLAASMNPPWPDESNDPRIEDLVAEEYRSKRRRRWSNEKLCALLGITAERARELNLLTIRPKEVETESRNTLPHQRELIEKRKEFARQYIDRFGLVSARRLAEVLHENGHLNTPKNHETANQILNALGYTCKRSAGRARKSP